MDKKKILAFLSMSLLLAVFFQNCSKTAISVSDNIAVPSETSLGNAVPPEDTPTPPSNPTNPPTNPVDTLMKSCDEAKSRGKLQTHTSPLTFENPNKVCDWGQNDNLDIKNGYVRARTEQLSMVSIPEGATICQVKMVNLDQQDFLYDDNIILTLNKYIIASTTDFSRHLTNTNGFVRYDWAKLVDKPAQNTAADTTPDKQYCAGKMEGFSDCLFPKTETVGTIHLQFDERVMQNILGMTTPNQLELGLVTTGDNDSTDCQHVPVRFMIEVSYY